MWRYFDLLSFRNNDEIAQLKRDVGGGRNPRDVKVMLAQEIVTRFHSRQAATDALADFEARFQRGAIPDEMPEVTLPAGPVAQVLKLAGLCSGTSEAMRMIDGGGVRANGERVSDKSLMLVSGEIVVLQVGKRKFARITIS
jgi:tyrosyl-tRNA synthetase